jgi:uncharacterized surface protein with fasciclin (FAS1) repeats
MKLNRRTTAIGLAALALALPACSDDDPASTTPDDSGAAEDATEETDGEPTEDESNDTMGSSGEFGAACSAVPADGEGSFAGMADDPVATAASNNPVLSTLVSAVGEAGLGDTLNGAEGITVFAPTDDAFAALDTETLDAAMADPSGLLTTVLTYHVVGERLTPEDLAGTHETLQGGSVEVNGSDEEFTVNDSASVVCGNVQTANATVYIVDNVLLPPEG